MSSLASQSIWDMIRSGGFAMYPLLVCSLLSWGVIFERLWSYRRLGHTLHSFHLSAMNLLLRNDRDALERLCRESGNLPTASLVSIALERLNSKDDRLRQRWQEAMERRRQLVNQDLRANLWILGTIGSASPFIGLFGTVIGILRSFQEMAKTGSGGFAVVASGISESLIATAAGIIVAVIAVMSYNAFQTRLSRFVLVIRLQAEELVELLEANNGS
ncbi:MotA/TolQ/ExbB proton channel family protein [Bdellovibrionota bacterium FG-2]